MRVSKLEKTHAAKISAAVDQLVEDPISQPQIGPDMDFGADEAGLLDTAQQLARLPELLGPVDPMLEQQIMRRVRTGVQQSRQSPPMRPVWVVAGLTAVLLAIMLLSPPGQTAVASFLSIFRLGQTEVRITPVDPSSAAEVVAGAEGTATKSKMTLVEAQSQVPFTIPLPTFLPDGMHFQEAISYSYPDLPAWVPQPIFVDLMYGDGAEHECTLRVYPIALGDRANITRMNLEATPIQRVEDVEVGGQPGMLLQLGNEKTDTVWQEVVWERDDLILALSATDLSKADLLRIARSVR
jgi:hypothetical protein